MKCIYCKEDKDANGFSGREHIVPESFGAFRHNLVLQNKVCDNCNSRFGSTLDLRLARDTYEGFYRHQSGVRQPAEYRHLGQRSTIMFRIGEGRLKNAYAFFEYSPHSGRLELRPLEQIGIKRRDSDEYDFFTFSRFPSPGEINTDAYDLDQRDCFVVLSDRFDEARRLLATIGLEFGQGSPFTSSSSAAEGVLLQVVSTIDDTVRRAIAKIAFNYLAYWNATEAVCHEAFDPVRAFIVAGVGPPIPLVYHGNKAILGDEPQAGKVREGHIVTVHWNDYHDAVLSNVSLFNTLTYHVLLAVEHTDLRVTVGKGHFWNTADMSVWELAAGRRSQGEEP